MSRIADHIARSGAAFGANLREAVEDMADASGFAGPGMAHKHMSSAFEYMLEKAEDELCFYADREDAAKALFVAHARLSYFGLHAQKDAIKQWKRIAEDAYRELSAFEKAAA